MADIIEAIRRYGFKVNTVSEEQFAKTIAKASKHEDESRTVLSLVAYANKNGEDLKFIYRKHPERGRHSGQGLP